MTLERNIVELDRDYYMGIMVRNPGFSVMFSLAKLIRFLQIL